jgi:hypothetical protein
MAPSYSQEVIKFPDFAAQKLEYIYYNPVEAGIVEKNIFTVAQEIIIMESDDPK